MAGKRHYEQALAGSPDDPELHYFSTAICWRRTHVTNCASGRALRTGSEPHPGNTKAHYQLISARAALRKPKIREPGNPFVAAPDA